jgi:hypothetical protein
MWAHPTVTASTMITHFVGGRKVRCHTVAVENIWERAMVSALIVPGGRRQYPRSARHALSLI